jgi:hypothetical protein
LSGLQADQHRRNEWLSAHAETLAHRDELAAAVAERRHELGDIAVATQPPHVVGLIGTKPEDASTSRRWTDLASRIEAYREEWGIEPSRLLERPLDQVQAREWDASVHAVRLLASGLTPAAGRNMEVGIGPDL